MIEKDVMGYLQKVNDKLTKKRNPNPSQEEHGITPVEYQVLLLIDDFEEVIETKSGLIVGLKAGDKAEAVRKQARHNYGRILAVGGMAFEDWTKKPKIGDHVFVPDFSGDIILGKDREQYRLTTDQTIKAIINF